MTDSRSRIVVLLRAELAQEAAAGFPRLSRTPYTDIIWFLDYFAALESAEREALLDGLARWGAMAFSSGGCHPRDVQELEKQHPAFARLRGPRSRMGYKGGTRYSSVKMLRMDPSLWEIGNYHPDWRQNCSRWAFQPRADLLPHLDALSPIPAPTLRKLVNATLARMFNPEKKNVGGGSWTYTGSYRDSTLKVWVDYGSPVGGQLSYGVSIVNANHTIRVSRLSYERLWDANLGWDYLTEENALRSIDLLVDQIEYLAKLVDRVNELAIPH